MSVDETQQAGTQAEGHLSVRSGVRIEMNAKGMPQPKVGVYEGTDEAEMQRVLDLAVLTYETVCQRLRLATNTQP